MLIRYPKMSLSIKHTFHVEKIEEFYSSVREYQTLQIERVDGGFDVIFYFMLNTALEIKSSRVTSGMGKTKFKIESDSIDGVMCASVSLRKVRFSFETGSQFGVIELLL